MNVREVVELHEDAANLIKSDLSSPHFEGRQRKL